METKRCHKCKEAKPTSAFHACARSRDGLQAGCRECKRAYYLAKAPEISVRLADRYKASPAGPKARATKYFAENRDTCRARARVRYVEKRSDEKQRIKDAAAQRDRDFPAQAASRVALRRARLRRCAPPWLTHEHRDQIRSFYVSAEALGMLLGEWHHVDHIVPVRGKTVCGLHVPWNLRVIPASDNLAKSNRIWPDQP